MIEVFITDVGHGIQAKQLITEIRKVFPRYYVTIDLEDCDKVLRIESADEVDSESIITLASQLGITASIMPNEFKVQGSMFKVQGSRLV